MFDIKKTTQPKPDKTHEIKDEKSENTINKIKQDLEKEGKQALEEKEPSFDTSNVKV
ncbi:unnamed protein product, partial [marine sediment metagenome]